MSASTLSLAVRLQRQLERFYELETLPAVDTFARATLEGQREQLLLVLADDGVVELEVRLPSVALAPPSGNVSLDTFCQVIEGVSHFVYLSERIRTALPTTQLELEMQAEVDKFVVLAFHAVLRRDVSKVRAIHSRLYERVIFIDREGSETGQRYRLANDAAARFCARFRDDSIFPKHRPASRKTLLHFYRGGQAEKLRLAAA